VGDESVARAPRAAPPPDSLFDEFWAIYPRKVGKIGAQRYWQRMRRKGTDFRQVIAAAERFRDECRANGTDLKYIPHPASWLNRGRYADDPTALAENSRPAEVSRPRGRLNDEQLLAEVIRLASDQDHPITVAAAIVRTVRRQVFPAALEGFPVTSAERGRELADMAYPDYLDTPEWQARRKIMLAQAGYRCQVCNRDRSLHVHHRTYERRGNEHPADLIVLCDECHKLFHDNRLLAAS